MIDIRPPVCMQEDQALLDPFMAQFKLQSATSEEAAPYSNSLPYSDLISHSPIFSANVDGV